MKQAIKVFKFGGASVKDAAGLKNVASILERFRAEKLTIIVSAMGKTTNALELLVGAYFNRTGEAYTLLNEIKKNHYDLIDQLFEKGHEVYDEVNDLFNAQVEWVLEEEPHENYDFVYDQIVSVGELVSTKIVASYLNKIGLPTQWLDARDVILTDDIYREGWVQWAETEENVNRKVKPMLEKPGFILTQGFIGTTKENFTTTLGREGSDYTASIFSFCLDAESMTIWKDVPGVLNADPRLFDNTVKLDRLSYKEAIEMTYYGAKVIHPKTIKPLQNKNIPLYVKSFIKPEDEGTYIGGDVDDLYPSIITVEKNQTMLQISTKDFSFVAEHHLSDMFQAIADLRLQVNMMQNSAISFSVCVTDLEIDDKVERFIERIQKDFKVVADRNLDIMAVRHPQENIVANLLKGKMVLMEERVKETLQFVVKEVPETTWKTGDGVIG